MSDSNENLLRVIFSAYDDAAALNEKEIDDIVGEPPYAIRRKKSRRMLWYQGAHAHADKLKLRHRDFLISYCNSIERLGDIDKLLAALPLEVRYESTSLRMARRAALDERDNALKQLKSMAPFGVKND